MSSPGTEQFLEWNSCYMNHDEELSLASEAESARTPSQPCILPRGAGPLPGHVLEFDSVSDKNPERFT
jgi:hypothetical protein